MVVAVTGDHQNSKATRTATRAIEEVTDSKPIELLTIPWSAWMIAKNERQRKDEKDDQSKKSSSTLYRSS